MEPRIQRLRVQLNSKVFIMLSTRLKGLFPLFCKPPLFSFANTSPKPKKPRRPSTKALLEAELLDYKKNPVDTSHFNNLLKYNNWTL